MKESILLIDGNNLAHRAQHKFALTTDGGKPSSVVYGFIYILGSLIRRNPSKEVYVVFDGGRHESRLKIMPDYKKRDRVMDEEEYKAFYDQLSFLREVLPLMGVRVVHEKGWEADDFIYAICRKHPKAYKTIVSSDKDFIQLLSHGSLTKILNPFKDAYITSLNCQELYGYEPEESIDYLCLDGDKSDHIPGVPGLGPKRIRAFLDEFGSVEDYIESENKGAWVKYPISEVWKRNRSMIDLRKFYLTQFKDKVFLFKNPTFEPRKVNSMLLKEYQVRLFSKDDFIKTFEKLWEKQ